MSTNPDFQNYYLMEMWIGTGMIIIWGFLIYFLKYLEIKNEIMVDSETVSASDFSILIENYPTNLTQFELQNQLSTYEQKID